MTSAEIAMSDAYDHSAAFDRGLAQRRATLGDNYVDPAMARGETDPIERDLQQMVNEQIWGKVWCRPGLALRDRSLTTLGVLIALGQPDELALHIRGALRNGLSQTEVLEALLQAGTYAGIARTNLAFRQARLVMAEVDRQQQ
jgi:alkylhydroperoxidase/carboxymuconolactone decarboxylase family protein YurZ